MDIDRKSIIYTFSSLMIYIVENLPLGRLVK